MASPVDDFIQEIRARREQLRNAIPVRCDVTILCEVIARAENGIVHGTNSEWLSARAQARAVVKEADEQRERWERIAAWGKEMMEWTAGAIHAEPGGAPVPMCVCCGVRPRWFDDYCKRCAHDRGLRPTGKV